MYGSPAVTIPFPNSGGCRWRPPQMEWAVGYLEPDDPRLGRFQRIMPRDPDPEPGLDTAPAFTTEPEESAWKGEDYVYRPRVVDATGNASTWYLEDGPEGMTIDRHSGVVSWHPTKSARVDVAIGVRNVYGGTRRQCWTLRVRHPGVLRPPAADAITGDPRPWAFRFKHPDKPLVLASPAKTLQTPHPAIPGLGLDPHPADGWEMVFSFPRVTRTAQGYDGAGRTLWTENAAGVRTYYFYTREGQVDYTLIDLDGDLSTTGDQSIAGKNLYDQYGRQVASVVDRDGDLSTTSDQSTTRYVYDTQGRVIRTNYDDGTSVSLTYDHMGRKRSETDQLGNTTWYEYDSMGRLAAVVLPPVKHPVSGQDVHVCYEYGYDASGNQISLRDNIYQTDPAQASTIDSSGARETVFTYDWRGNQTSRTLPDGSTEYFFYDAVSGRQTRHVSFEGRVTTLEYDDQDNLVRKLYYSSVAAWNNGAGVSGHTISYSYDSQGRVVREADSRLGDTVTSYDSQGRTIRVESPSGILNYEYDVVTGQVSRTWTGANAASPVTDVRNSYDALGRLETVTTYARDGQAITPEQASYIYDKIGNLDQLRHSNGIISDYVYDQMNRLSTLTHYAPDATPDDLSDNAVLQRFVYGYHDNGNKSGETATDASGATSTWNWDYDALGRLIEERHDNAVDSLDYTADYTFDLVGNRLVKTTRTDAGLERIQSTFDANDRLLNERKVFDEVEVEVTTYSYSATEQTGKLVTNTQTGTKTQTSMTYNEQGRLSSIVIHSYENNILVKTVTQEYEYDSSGIKVRQTETVDTNGDGVADESKTTSYLNDKQNHTGYSQVLEETVEVQGQAVEVTTYTIGHDVLAQFSAAAGFLALLADGHGSTRAVADALGNIVQQYAYDAYGNAHGFDASQALTNLLYSGEQFNPVSGLQYLRARWYNPQSGTFNRLDPFAGDTQNPQSFHKYTYTHGDPINNIDPTGNFSIAHIIVGTVAIGLLAGGITGYYAIERSIKGVVQGAIIGGMLGLAAGVGICFPEIVTLCHTAYIHGTQILAIGYSYWWGWELYFQRMGSSTIFVVNGALNPSIPDGSDFGDMVGGSIAAGIDLAGRATRYFIEAISKGIDNLQEDIARYHSVSIKEMRYMAETGEIVLIDGNGNIRGGIDTFRE